MTCVLQLVPLRGGNEFDAQPQTEMTGTFLSRYCVVLFNLKLNFCHFCEMCNTWSDQEHVFVVVRSPLSGACNSHTKPMSRRFYGPVYF